MKKFLVIMLFAAVFLFSGLANATLWDRGGGLIYDDVLDITWLQDAKYAMTSGYDPDGVIIGWNQATAWANNLAYYDSVRNVTWDDWRLPITPGATTGYTNEGEMGHLYYDTLGDPQGGPLSNAGPFINLHPGFYWSGTESGPGRVWGFNFSVGRQREENVSNDGVVWAVRSGDVGPVPIPGAVWLLGSGLVGLAGFRRKFKKA